MKGPLPTLKVGKGPFTDYVIVTRSPSDTTGAAVATAAVAWWGTTHESLGAPAGQPLAAMSARTAAMVRTGTPVPPLPV